jgi:hypothetical protein
VRRGWPGMLILAGFAGVLLTMNDPAHFSKRKISVRKMESQLDIDYPLCHSHMES